ncbi:MAG: ester cyclase [Janthinobacterium lividum]
MSNESNKEVVRRFNLEVIQQGDRQAFQQLVADGFINHSAPAGTPTGPEGMWHTFQNILRPALAGLQVVIHDQVAEGDKVTTRKTITGMHEGDLLGIPPTHKQVSIAVVDIVRVENGQYVEHWGINTLPQVLAGLREG